MNGPRVVMIFSSPWYCFVVFYGRSLVVVDNSKIVNFYILIKKSFSSSLAPCSLVDEFWVASGEIK